MAVDCSTAALLTSAKCFLDCIPPGAQAAVQTYLLAVKANAAAGTSMDPSTLLNAARCFLDCIPPGAQAEVQTYLLCTLANA